MTITEQPLTTADAELSRVRRMLTLRQDVKVAAEGDDVELTHPWGRQRVHALGAPTVRRLLALGAGPVDADALAGDREAGRLLSLLGRFPYLVTSILDDPLTGPLATAVPIARSAATPGAPDLGTTAVVLSRFAYLRRLPDGPADGGGGTIGQGCVMESPLAPYRVTLHQPAAAAFVAALTTPRTVAEAAALAGLPEQSGAVLAALLAGTGFMEPAAGAAVGAAPRSRRRIRRCGTSTTCSSTPAAGPAGTTTPTAASSPTRTYRTRRPCRAPGATRTSRVSTCRCRTGTR